MIQKGCRQILVASIKLSIPTLSDSKVFDQSSSLNLLQGLSAVYAYQPPLLMYRFLKKKERSFNGSY